MPGKTRGKDYRRLLLTNFAIGISGSLLILSFFVFYLASDYQRSVSAEQERLQALTSSAASRTQSIVGSIVIAVRLLDEWIQNNPETDPRFSAEFNSLVDTFRLATGDTIDLRLVDADGGLFYFPSKDTTPLADVSDREYYRAQKTSASGTFFYASPIKSRVTGRLGMPISYHLRPNRFGLLEIFAIIEFDNFDDIFSDILANTERSVSLVRKSDGIVLARAPYDEYLVGKKYDFTPDASGYGIINVYNPERNRRVIGYQELDGIPLFVLVGDSFDMMWREWLFSALRNGAIAGVVLAAYVYLNLRLIRLLKNGNEIRGQLERAAHYDNLTKMKSRGYFFERFAEELERAKRTGEPIALLVADIDHFKTVNDTVGHPEGDRVLREVAEAVEKTVRTIDIAGRVGGEEFAVVLVKTGLADGLVVSERIRESALAITAGSWTGGLSIGVAEWKGYSETLNDLYKRADDALYEAKRNGRNRVIAAR